MTTVGVLGPGAVGGALAVPLSLAGHRVTCVARPETAAAIRRDGLTLVRDGAELHARPEAVDHLSEPLDVLLVTVKAPALSKALERIEAAVGVTLPLLNGIEHMEALRAGAEGAVVAATVGRLEAYREGPTRIIQATAPMLVTVAAGANDAPATLGVSGIDVRVDGSEQDVLWEKLARLAPLAALTAATQRSVGELRSDPRLRAGVEEACAVASADGASTTVSDQWAIIEAMPDLLTTSTARDIAAGRPSELDAIAGAVVRAGSRLGVPTPILEELIGLCRA
jgi:2-dehydropantoate 2-reductase